MNNKQKLISTLILAALGSYLTYKQSSGINIFIFSIFSLCLGYFIKQRETSTLKFLWYASPMILTSICISIYPQLYTRMVWLLSYGVFWIVIQNQLNTLLIPLQVFTTIIQSPLDIKKHFPKNKANNPKNKHQFKIVCISTIIVFLFSSLYANANPAFGELFSYIDLSFINSGYIWNTLLLLLLLFGLVFIVANEKIEILNRNPLFIPKSEVLEKHDVEFKIAKLSIWALVILLGLVNLTDIGAITTGILPQGITYSQYVHQGFYTLIFALFIAVGVTLYFFRNQLNFHNQIQQLRLAMFFWIGQNTILAVITGVKNYMYISNYGLTYKRIFVFICLLFSILALAYCIQKISKPITLWNYSNKTVLAFYIILLTIAIVPVDYLITNYNIRYSQTLDLKYLVSLSHPDYKLLHPKVEQSNILNGYECNVYWNRKNNLLNKYSDWQSWNLYKELQTNH